MKYFYIIKRNGVIYEMAYTPEGYQAAVSEHIKGGILIIKPVGYEQPQSTNAKDIVDIVDEQGYDTYIQTARPKIYLRNGVWYDSKEHKEVRVEPWLKKRRAEQKTIEAAEDKPISEAQRKKNLKKIAEIRENLKNKFKK